jgi:hypothetical protein
MKWCHLFVRHQGKIAAKFEILWGEKILIYQPWDSDEVVPSVC